MTALLRSASRRLALALAMLLPLGGLVPAQAAEPGAPNRTIDYIVAVVNNELVTQIEVEQRMAQVRIEAQRNRNTLPSDEELRRQVVELLINERLQTTAARDSGMRVDDAELDRAVDNIASMNKLSVSQLRQRLREDGMDYARFRANLRDQILADRIREREVQSRIKVSDAEIDAFLAEKQAGKAAQTELNIAQILVTVPEGASDEVVAQRRARVAEAQARLKAGEPFALVAKAYSEDSNRDRGGEIGPRPLDRLPDLFVQAVEKLAVGAVTAEPVRSGAGFHLLKLVSRGEADPDRVTQTRARHILLRPSARLSADAAQRRLAEFRSEILAGRARFEDLARDYSEDGSAARGGDLGWTSPGTFVPEFEITMNNLPVGGISAPIVSRFGVHLIQVMERREAKVDREQVRTQARAALRERKYADAYEAWLDELRSKAFVEMREPPL